MILHTVVFTWTEDTSDDDISRFEDDLRALAAAVEGVVSFETARDGRFRAGNADFAIVARFADEAALRRYLTHGDHLRMLDEYARALVARKESVQAEVG